MLTNVREVTSAFVGRAADLASIASRFDDGARLVTIVAPGGMGKTRVAMRYAALHAQGFAAHGGGGAWFCDLTDAADLKTACSVVASALGVALAPSKDIGTIVTRLGDELARRKRVLVILDNVEHLVADVARALGVWTGVAQQARFLVTSRTVLGAPGEHLVLLEPLQLPRPGSSRDAVLTAEAVELFARRAREVRPGFEPSDGELAALVDVVRATDGIPLAIELAAAKVRVLSLEQMRQRFAASLDLLTRRDDSGKHGSMRRAILDSLDQLADGERRILAACSVFHGGFALEAAEEVLRAPGLSVLSTLDVLVARSLVRARESDGELRFSLFETIRELGSLELSEKDDDRASVAARHAAYYARHAAELGQRVETSGNRPARATLGKELGNLLAAFEHTVGRAGDADASTAALAIAFALEPVLLQRGQFELSLALFERAVKELPAGGDGARAIALRATARFELGETEAAHEDLRLALALSEAAGDALLAALASVRLGQLVELQGDTLGARAHFAHGLGRLEQAPPGRARRVREAEIRACLGHVARREGQLDQAEREGRRALALYRDADCEEELARVLYETGVLCLFREQYADAHAHFEEALVIARRLGQRQAEGALLSGRGILLQEQGKLDEALADHAQAVRIFHEIGSRHREGSALYYLGGGFLEQGSTGAASKLFSQSHAIVIQAGMRRYEALVAGARAVAAIDAQDPEAAEEWLGIAREAAARCESEPTLAATTRIHEACVRLSTGPHDGREALVEEARSLLISHSNDDVRFAFRLLLARARPAQRRSGDVLAVAEDGGSFRVPGSDASVDLSRRAPLRKILVALAQLRVEAPGESLSMDDVVRAGWPSERMGEAAAANRVRVALATLRKLGLRRAIVTGRGGYLLDPAMAVVIGAGSS